MNASSNARWIGVSQASRVITQLVSMTVLSRLLKPEDFGIMAMALVVTNFASMVRDMGTGAALVQREGLTEAITTSVFWFNVVLGIAVGLVLILVAPLIAAGFRDARLTHILWSLAPTFPLASSATAHYALLERSSNFKLIARIEVTASTVGVLAAVVAAFLGAGVYSLVLQTMLVACLSSAQYWAASRWRPKSWLDFRELRSVLRFSSNVGAFNIVNYFSRNADDIIIGRYIGAAQLGIYSLAYRLMLFPIQNLTFVANRALFPVMSRQQDNPAEMAALYLRVLRVIVTISAPLMLGFFAVREAIVRLAFGPRWLAAADVLFWLTPTAVIQSVVSTLGPILMATGRAHLLLKIGIFCAVTQITAFFIGVRYDIVHVAAFYSVATIVNAFPILIVLMRVLETPMMRLFQTVAPALTSAILMSIGVLSFQRFVVFPPERWREQLFSSIGVGFILYPLLLQVVFRQSARDLRSVFLLRRAHGAQSG